MALTVEDGTGKSDADSFIVRDDFIAWAVKRGKTLPNTDATDVFLRRAADYINSKEDCFQGARVSADQALSFPRSGVTLNDFEIAENEIPQAVILAQMELALAASDGVSLFPAGNDQFVVFEKVGPIATSFSEKFGNSTPVHVPAAEYLFDQLCGGGGFALKSVRV